MSVTKLSFTDHGVKLLTHWSDSIPCDLQSFPDMLSSILLCIENAGGEGIARVTE